MELPPLTENPLVSVLVANYNYARYIGDALESTLAQTYPHFEVIVCDDGSSDDSCAVIESYVKRDRRIRLVRKENGGIASALNVAYAVAKGEIICFLDADDLFYPEKLEMVVSAFGNQPTFGLFIHQVLPVSETREPIYVPSPKALENGWTGSQALRRGGDGRYFPPCSGYA